MPQLPGYLLRAFDASGDPAPGATLHAFAGGTTTAVSIYLDAPLLVPIAPVADSAGVFPTLYIGAGTYKFDLRDADGASLPGFPQDMISVPQSSADATFSVLDYIMRAPAGAAQAALIRSGDHASQDADIVTAGIQAAFVAWYESGASGAVSFPPGQYRINDGLLNGVTGGKAVCKHIYDDNISTEAGRDNRVLALVCTGAERLIVDETFEDSQFVAGTFPDKWVFRFDADNGGKPFNGVVGKMPRMTWIGGRANRWKCPGAVKLRQTNGLNMDFQSNGPRGDEWNWPGSGILIDTANNADIYNIRVRAGATPLLRELYREGVGTFDFQYSGDNLKHRDFFATPFANPASGSTYWDGKLMLLAVSDTAADKHLVKIENRVFATTVRLSEDGFFELAESYNDFHASFGFPTCSVTVGSNVITVDMADPLHDDMVGKLVFVEAAPDNRNGTGVTLAYVSAVDTTAGTMTLVGNDGSAVDWAESRTGVTWWMGGGFALCQVYNSTYNGQNNDVNIHSLTAEKCGGINLFFQGCDGVRVFGGKGHPRSGQGGDAEMDFARSGLCAGFDGCEALSIYGMKFTWANYIDYAQERVFSLKVWGDDNNIAFRDCEIFGSASIWDVINVKEAGDNRRIAWCGGHMQADGWADDDVDHRFIGGIDNVERNTLANTVSVGLPMYIKNSGVVPGFEDALGIYRGTLREERVSVSSGEITVKEGNYIIVDTESDAATDDLHTINGLHDGKTGIMAIRTTTRTVVLKNGIGNIETPGNADVTLDQTRDSVSYRVQNGKIRLTSVQA